MHGGGGVDVRGDGYREGRRGGLERPWGNGIIEMEEKWIWEQGRSYANHGAILGLARVLTLEGFPGVQGDFSN